MMTWIHFLWNLYSQLTMGFEKQSKCTKECKCLQGQRGDSHWLQTIFLAWIPLVASMDWKWLCDQTFLHPGIFRDSNFNTQTIHLGSQWICRFWMSRSGWAPRFFTAKRQVMLMLLVHGPRFQQRSFQRLQWKRSNTYWSGWTWGEKTSLLQSCHSGFSL